MSRAFSRRGFVSLPALAALRGTRAQARVAAELNGEDRRQTALQIRQDAAIAQSLRPVAGHVGNGDENAFPGYIASFTKGLPHTQLGEVQSGVYETLLHALSIGKQ